MGTWVESGHDNVGTGPERARPRLLWIRDHRWGRPATRQGERKGASQRGERAAACAHEGDSAVEVLKKKKVREVMGCRRFGIELWEMGKHLGSQLARLAIQIAGVFVWERRDNNGRLNASKRIRFL